MPKLGNLGLGAGAMRIEKNSRNGTGKQWQPCLMGKPRYVLKAVETGGQHTYDEHEVTRTEIKQVKETLSQLEDTKEKNDTELKEID